MKFALFALLAATTSAHVIDGAKFNAAEDQFESFLGNTEKFLETEFAPVFKTYVHELEIAEASYKVANQAALKKLQAALEKSHGKFQDLKKEFATYEKQAEGVVTKEGHADIKKLEADVESIEKKLHH